MLYAAASPSSPANAGRPPASIPFLNATQRHTLLIAVTAQESKALDQF